MGWLSVFDVGGKERQKSKVLGTGMLGGALHRQGVWRAKGSKVPCEMECVALGLLG